MSKMNKRKPIPIAAVISMATLFVIGTSLVSAVNTVITVYNTMVKSKVTVEKSLADLESQYQRRYALVDNLVAIVKETKAFEQVLMEFERSIYTQTAEAKASATRLSLQQPEATTTRMSREAKLTTALSQFMEKFLVLAQHYPTIPDPQVKERMATIEALTGLKNSLMQIEESILTGRQTLNESVRVYNQNLAIFPANLFVRNWNFAPLEGFEVLNADARQDAHITF